MADITSPCEPARQGIELANMADVTIIVASNSQQKFTVHTSLLLRSSKWYQEKEHELIREAKVWPDSASDNSKPPTIKLPSPHTAGAVDVFVQYLYQKDVIPHTSTFIKHGIDAYYLSQFLEAADFTRCCQRAIEHALTKDIIKPSLHDLARALKFDDKDPVRKQIFDNIVGRIAEQKFHYTYKGEQCCLDDLTWKEIHLAVGEKISHSNILANKQTDDRDGPHATTESQPSHAPFFSRIRPSCPGGLFCSCGTHDTTSTTGFRAGARSTAVCAGSTTRVPNHNTEFGSTQPQSNAFGAPFAEPFGKVRWSDAAGNLLGGATQEQSVSSHCLFGIPQTNATTAGPFGGPAEQVTAGTAFGRGPGFTSSGFHFGDRSQVQPQSSDNTFGRSSGFTGSGIHSGNTSQVQPQSLGNVFGQSHTANIAPGLFGNPTQGWAGPFGGGSNDFGYSNRGPGLFGLDSFASRSFGGVRAEPTATTRTFPSRPNDGGLFGSQSQVQSRNLNNQFVSSACQGFGSSGTNIPSQFGGFTATSGGVAPGSNTGGPTEKPNLDLGTATTPYAASLESEGNTSRYHHIGFMDAYQHLSPEELRLNDYKQGHQNSLRPSQTPTNTTLFGTLQSAARTHPSQQGLRSTTDLNSTTELDRLSRKLIYQDAELEVLRTKVQQMGIDSANAKTDAEKQKKTMADQILALTTEFEAKLATVQGETAALTRRQEEYERNKIDENTGPAIEPEIDLDDEDDSATSTPIRILTPTSSAAPSPANNTSNTPGDEPDDFVTIDSPTAPIATAATPWSTLTPKARSLLDHLIETTLPSFNINTSEVRTKFDVRVDEVAMMVGELSSKGFLHYDGNENCYRWGKEQMQGRRRR